MMAQICVTMTSYLHSADVMEIALMYFVHDEINMIPCTVGRLFSRIRYQNPQILKPSNFKSLEILQDSKDIYST